MNALPVTGPTVLKLINTLLHFSAFRDDNEMSECPFSTNSITLEELSVVEEIAKNLGLFVTPRRLQASPSF